jgi:hypothetical protein
VSSQATVKKKTRSTTHPLGIIFNKFSLALQTHPAWHGFNDIPQNISINNSIANRLKEHLLYQVNQFLQPKLKCLTYMLLRLGLLIFDSDTFSSLVLAVDVSLVFKLLSLQSTDFH